MLNGKEVIDINGKKYLFCGFSKAKIISRKNNSDLAYSQEIIVLGRMTISLKSRSMSYPVSSHTISGLISGILYIGNWRILLYLTGDFGPSSSSIPPVPTSVLVNVLQIW